MRGDRPSPRLVTQEEIGFTPHARGSTLFAGDRFFYSFVYPACAGIDLVFFLSYLGYTRLPRMRGDRPSRKRISGFTSMFTPHARGSTYLHIRLLPSVLVYPACAGIDLPSLLHGHAGVSLPRMRGDRPGSFLLVSVSCRFTPHARGSTHRGPEFRLPGFVYPACAGIDPSSLVFPRRPQCLPRMRGDRPEGRIIYLTPSKFTPHARGSTRPILDPLSWFGVYPACAGIDLVRRI